jgi:hypothetical protein
MSLTVPGYCGDILAITQLNYDGVAMTSNCFSGDIQFIKSGTEALKRLDKEV